MHLDCINGWVDEQHDWGDMLISQSVSIFNGPPGVYHCQWGKCTTGWTVSSSCLMDHEDSSISYNTTKSYGDSSSKGWVWRESKAIFQKNFDQSIFIGLEWKWGAKTSITWHRREAESICTALGRGLEKSQIMFRPSKLHLYSYMSSTRVHSYQSD